MFYNFDYLVDANQQVKVLGLRGYATGENAAKAKPVLDTAARVLLGCAGDVASLGDDVRLALAEYKAGLDEKANDDPEALWALINLPNPKKKVITSLPTTDNDGTAEPGDKTGTANTGEVPTGKVKKMATKKAAKKAVSKKAAKKATGPRGEKVLKVRALLLRKSGCTAAEVLEATGWPAVSMPAMSKACGLNLRKEKVKGKRTQYFGS